MKKILVLITILILLCSLLFATTYRWQIKIINSDGTTFNSSDSAGAAVRLWRSNVSGAEVTLSGSMTEVSYGIWYYSIDEDSSGYYLVETYTTATPSWTAVSGFDPVYIGREEPLYLDGGTMSGDIVMGGNDIMGISTLDFADSTNYIQWDSASKFYVCNLVDKSATETIAGAWDFDGACTVTAGSFDFTEDKLLLDSIIAQPYIYITYSEGPAGNIKAAIVSKTLFICDATYEVVSIEGFTETAETTAATLYIQVERLSGVEAKGAGDDILTNNTNNGFNLKGTAKTARVGTLTNTTLADGDRIGLVLSADGTEAAGLSITIKLKRI